MQKDFLDFIKKHALIDKEDNVLLAVSGGVDSVVMAHLFHETDFAFGIAHCNFQLRGTESEADAAFVSDLAKKFGASFHLKHFDTAAYASEKGISTQMAARELRYEWFVELAGSFGYAKIASAHHKDDNVETLVHNLVRGTSISGLRGMLPHTNTVIRPLLFTSRAEILDFAGDRGLVWREDSSNENDDYKRNFIRHQILPGFAKLNPNYLDVIDASMKKNHEVERVFRDYLKVEKSELLEETTGSNFKISIEKLELHSIGPYVLSEVLSEFGFNYDQCHNLLEKLPGVSGKQFKSKDFVLTIDRKYIFIDLISGEEPQEFWIETETKVLDAASNLYFERRSGRESVEKDTNKAFLDFDQLEFPLQLRNWKEGDAFVPLGMRGKKKLSDFMIDSKIPLNLKKQQQVILSQGEIVWVVGRRIDDRFKVTDQTKNIFLITRNNSHV